MIMYKQMLNMDGTISEWVYRLEDGACVQVENQEYLKWVAEGNEPLPADGE